MAMKLIRKKAPRGGLFRWLTEDEETAVKCFCGEKSTYSSRDRELAQSIIIEMRQKDAWLQCNCIAGDSPALNSAGLMQESQTLFLKGFNHPHDIACPMYRKFKGDEDATSSGTRKKAGSIRIDYMSFLPVDEHDSRIRVPGRLVDVGTDRTRRKKRSRLARLLLSLIEDAGLNQLEVLSPPPSRSVRESLNALIAVTEIREFVRGRVLSEIVHFQPGMSDYAQEKLMQALERTDNRWPAKKARVFYQIFMSEQVTRESATFTWSGGELKFAPERGVSINGETLEGQRPPYWVIMAFRRGHDGSVICSEGYAHALFERRCPVPVDSEMERQTLRSILTVAGWLQNKPEAPELTLQKPLFDIEVDVNEEKGYVLPDFIVSATNPDGCSHTVVIETMGYTDDEYCERKAEQHVGMRRIGILQTDPPQWPNEVSKPFTRQLYGVMHHLDKLSQPL